MLQELKMNEKETKEFFIQAFKEQNLVPIIGSGFTGGIKTLKGGCVPRGSDLRNYMIECIINEKKYNKEDMKNDSFSTVAEQFEQTFPEPSQKEVKDYFYRNFTGVRIDKPHQMEFLNDIDWEYIYTLNIDTGIEDSNRNGWEVFYPNRKFDDRVVKEGCKKLYKIHGDVGNFCKNLDYNEMILTESQYIQSLELNEQFHDLLSADCGNKNLLYIGCSLDDEIDIKYSVLTDKNRNQRIRETRGIYVTADELSEYKKNKLELFNISHLVQLSNVQEYEMFYEFLVQCYKESQVNSEKNIEQYKFKELEKLSNKKEENIRYLANLEPQKDKLPYYYISSLRVSEVKFVKEKVNVIIGRRFSGKSFLAYALFEKYLNYKRYYISENDSLAEKDIAELLNEKNAFIVFDSEALDDNGFNNVMNRFDDKKDNIVCVILNSFTDVVNLITVQSNMINVALPNMNGKILSADLTLINEKLNELGIAAFSEKQNLIDNTLRIGNVYDLNMVSNYDIDSVEELELIIWLLTKSKIYYEEIVTLGIAKQYKNIVEKFAPFIQEERCKKGEAKKHSHFKIICNGKLGLLQILGAYLYTPKSEMESAVIKIHQGNVCKAIYQILYKFDKINQDTVKTFLLFDSLNDIFSRIYSKRSIKYLTSNGKEGKKAYGASGVISEIYKDEKIKNLKADDPNYWLQRAKSVYITSYKGRGIQSKLKEAIDWAKKAEEDSKLKIEKGETRYKRTESNAIMQIAMLYGKLAKIRKYDDIEINNYALNYYFKGLSDSNNINAAKTLLHNSRGTEDFNELIEKVITDKNCVNEELGRERDYLIGIKMKGEILYRI